MKFVLGLGSNLASRWGDPETTIITAISALSGVGFHVDERSPLYLTRPMGPAGQPDYVNAVVTGYATLPPLGLLGRLKALERASGRSTGRRWAARTLDLDILDAGGLVGAVGTNRNLILPHAGLADRDFVLLPLSEIAPFWRHPVSRLRAASLLRQLKPSQRYVKQRL